uniref:Tyrosine transaminase n=1 Tax=Trypanosoma cruzi TaxID=5693 RepID=Q7M4A9_TRYCR
AITAICDAGDYALVPQPGFPHYETVCKAYDFYNCRPENDWEADLYLYNHIGECIGLAPT